jgi:hypothetical protein
VATTNAHTELASLLRPKYLKELSSLERWFETLPGIAGDGPSVASPQLCRIA